MPNDSPLEACCRRCSEMQTTRWVKYVRVFVLCVCLFLMILQDAFLKAVTGFSVSSIEPCEDPLTDTEFFYLQWLPSDYELNNASCAVAASLMQQTKDSDFAALPVPTNTSWQAKTANELIDGSYGTAIRNLWGAATLFGPIVWWLAEVVCIMLPIVYNARMADGRGSVWGKLIVLLLCLSMSVASNLMLIVNATVQYHEDIGVFAATLTTTELLVHFAAAAALVVTFSLMVLILLSRALGTCLHKRCRTFCKYFAGVDEEDALQGLIIRVCILSALITVIGLVLKIISIVSVADQYEKEARLFLANFSFADFDPQSFLDRPSASSDFIGDYFLYQRRSRPNQSLLEIAYANTRDVLSACMAAEVFLTFVAMFTQMCSLVFIGCLGCCRRANNSPSYKV